MFKFTIRYAESLYIAYICVVSRQSRVRTCIYKAHLHEDYFVKVSLSMEGRDMCSNHILQLHVTYATCLKLNFQSKRRITRSEDRKG